jgi:hypothetical protein
MMTARTVANYFNTIKAIINMRILGNPQLFADFTSN